MDIKKAFIKLHVALHRSQQIHIINSKNSIDQFDEELYLKSVDMKLGFKVPADLRPYFVCSNYNSMNYHYVIDGIPSGQGSWGLVAAFTFIKNKDKELKELIDGKEVEFVVFDRAYEDMYFGLYRWDSSKHYLPTEVYFYKNGHFTETSLDYKSYLENLVHCAGLAHWPLLFTKVDAQHHSYQYEFMKLAQGYHDLQQLLPEHDFSVFQQKLKEKGLL